MQSNPPFFRRVQAMATPLGTSFVTDEQIVAQGDVLYKGKTVESLVVEFDHLPLMEDVTLCHDLFVSDKCSPQRSRHLLYASEKGGFDCKNSFDWIEDYNRSVFRLQGREDVES